MARLAIAAVASVSAGPPCGGLYLNPPSRGGLCDGVTTMPSACPRAPRSLFAAKIASETAGVGVKASAESTRTSTPLATSTSRAVSWAGADSACGSRPMNSSTGIALRCPVLADRLRRGGDVRLVEGAVEAGPAVAGRTEHDPLVGVGGIGHDVVVGADDLVDIDEILGLRRLSGALVCHTGSLADAGERVDRWMPAGRAKVAGCRSGRGRSARYPAPIVSLCGILCYRLVIGARSGGVACGSSSPVRRVYSDSPPSSR